MLKQTWDICRLNIITFRSAYIIILQQMLYYLITVGKSWLVFVCFVCVGFFLWVILGFFFKGKVFLLANFCGDFKWNWSHSFYYKPSQTKGKLYNKIQKQNNKKPQTIFLIGVQRKSIRHKSQLARKEIPAKHNNRKELHMVKHQELPRELAASPSLEIF